MCVCVYVCVCLCMFVYVCVCMFFCVFLCVFLCFFLRFFVCCVGVCFVKVCRFHQETKRTEKNIKATVGFNPGSPSFRSGPILTVYCAKMVCPFLAGQLAAVNNIKEAGEGKPCPK